MLHPQESLQSDADKGRGDCHDPGEGDEKKQGHETVTPP